MYDVAYGGRSEVGSQELWWQYVVNDVYYAQIDKTHVMVILERSGITEQTLPCVGEHCFTSDNCGRSIWNDAQFQSLSRCSGLFACSKTITDVQRICSQNYAIFNTYYFPVSLPTVGHDHSIAIL